MPAAPSLVRSVLPLAFAAIAPLLACGASKPAPASPGPGPSASASSDELAKLGALSSAPDELMLHVLTDGGQEAVLSGTLSSATGPAGGSASVGEGDDDGLVGVAPSKEPTIVAADATLLPGAPPGADAVLAKNRWRFRTCYKNALLVDPKAQGTVLVEAHVDADGRVTESKGKGATPAKLATCVANAFLSMRFGEGHAGEIAVKVLFAAK